MNWQAWFIENGEKWIDVDAAFDCVQISELYKMFRARMMDEFRNTVVFSPKLTCGCPECEALDDRLTNEAWWDLEIVP